MHSLEHGGIGFGSDARLGNVTGMFVDKDDFVGITPKDGAGEFLRIKGYRLARVCRWWGGGGDTNRGGLIRTSLEALRAWTEYFAH